jgi:pimeloyl-ACP methyl ester carboxylesterase
MISDKNKEINLFMDGIKIRVWTYGNSKNPPIFFIHGFFNSFSEYVGDLPVRYLMKNYFVVAFDLPGFGKSKYVNINRIEFIEKIRRQIIKDKKIVLFGVSYGGLISVKYYIKYPKNVNSIIIAGTPVFNRIFNIYKVVGFLPKYKNKKIYFKDFREFDETFTKEKLNEINIPVLLYYNSADFIANIFMGKWLNKNIPNSRIFIAKKQNHSWLLHRIDKNGFLNEIENFLQAVKAASKNIS